MNSLIGPVGQRIQAEMRQLGYDEVRFDKMGNTIGRIGDGPKVIVYDSHIDTVGIGDLAEWEWDPSGVSGQWLRRRSLLLYASGIDGE